MCLRITQSVLKKASGTRWVDHKMRARGKLNDKSGICPAYLGNVINGTSRQCDCAKLQGKYKKTYLSKFSLSQRISA